MALNNHKMSGQPRTDRCKSAKGSHTGSRSRSRTRSRSPKSGKEDQSPEVLQSKVKEQQPTEDQTDTQGRKEQNPPASAHAHDHKESESSHPQPAQQQSKQPKQTLACPKCNNPTYWPTTRAEHNIFTCINPQCSTNITFTVDGHNQEPQNIIFDQEWLAFDEISALQQQGQTFVRYLLQERHS
jgi:hypothetical protein